MALLTRRVLGQALPALGLQLLLNRRSTVKWFEMNPTRFEMERRLLGQYYRGCKIVKKKGKIRVLIRYRARRDNYVVEGVFPNRFPYSPMDVYILTPSIKKEPPHYFGSGRLCLHNSGDVSPETTAIVYLDWAKQWIELYERWLNGKTWPKTNRRL